MSRIESLTEEQVAQLAVYRDRWLTIGLSTAPTDKLAAEVAVREVYLAANLSPPKIVVWLRSPLEGAIGAAILAGIKIVGSQVVDQVVAQVRDQVVAQVRDQVVAQVRDQVRAQVQAQVGDQVGDQVVDQVRDQVRAQVWDQVVDQVRDQVRDQVGDQVRDQVWDQVWRAGYGLHDAGWVAFYEYFDRVCGLNSVHRLRGIANLAQAAGWWWPFANAVIFTERPVHLSRDAQNRLHGGSRAAIEYSDGWGVYAWHGTRVPKDVILQPELITVERIDNEVNAEVRRVMLERFGLPRYVLESGAEVLAEDVDGLGLPRRLLRKRGRGGAPDLVTVHVKNSTLEPDGSRKDYVLCVHHELRPLLGNGQLGAPQKLTPHNAIASTFGKRGEEYRPRVET